MQGSTPQLLGQLITPQLITEQLITPQLITPQLILTHANIFRVLVGLFYATI